MDTTYYVDFYPMDQVPPDLVDIIKKDLQLTEGDKTTYNEIYEEQLFDINAKNPGSYFVAAYQEPDTYLGGVTLFLDVKIPGRKALAMDTPSPGFQGIAKSQIGTKIPVKLNSLLIPAIIDFLKPLGFHRVYVNPFPIQRKILEQYYDFVQFNTTTPIITDEIGDYISDRKRHSDVLVRIF